MHQAASFVFQEKALAKTTGNVDILFIGTYKKKKNCTIINCTLQHTVNTRSQK